VGGGIFILSPMSLYAEFNDNFFVNRDIVKKRDFHTQILGSPRSSISKLV
jgi:hypothetical protein